MKDVNINLLPSLIYLKVLEKTLQGIGTISSPSDCYSNIASMPNVIEKTELGDRSLVKMSSIR